MPMRYFELAPWVGIDPDGCPQPATSFGVSYLGSSTMVGREIVDQVIEDRIAPADALGPLRARIIPDTRFIEVADPVLAVAVQQTPGLVEIDQPTSKQIAACEEATRHHRERYGPAAPAKRKTTTKPAAPAQEG